MSSNNFMNEPIYLHISALNARVRYDLAFEKSNF